MGGKDQGAYLLLFRLHATKIMGRIGVGWGWDWGGVGFAGMSNDGLRG